MLIICYDDFISSMNPFVQWKNKKGIPTEIVPVSTIGNTVNDLQDYINNYYYNNGLTYLLLVGDAAHYLHRLAGQVINLGFSDADILCEELISAYEKGYSINSYRVLKSYELRRKSRIWIGSNKKSQFCNR